MKLRIDGSLGHMDFSAAHFIPTIEKCAHLHGHNYYVNVDVEGEPVEGVLMDYGILKSIIRKSIEPFDHRILVPERSGFSTCTIDGDVCLVSYGRKKFQFPLSDVYLLDVEMSSSELLSKSILEKTKNEIFRMGNITKITICVYESPGQGACSEVSR
ncbi:MAG: 6-carboxytetrahydropterin synthase [Thermoplasmataceae archaeon]